MGNGNIVTVTPVAEPRFREPGHSTAYGDAVSYRLGKVERQVPIEGEWLDFGCNEGAYANALVEHGAAHATGIDVDTAAVHRAREEFSRPELRFDTYDGSALPYADASYDGVLLNEVLEHVPGDRAAVAEACRVLRSSGALVVFSPNRWFPFEGHGARWSEDRVLWGRPVPLMPWLPARLTPRVAAARNYWPRELETVVRSAGFGRVTRGWALVQFEEYKWLPERLAAPLRTRPESIENSPFGRFFAVSTFIVARP